ncbi:hypothetical protein Ddc_12159 [Ditylenchus destructor]|nr:hypothetical protein Ddc_12159 [Ditylenchus destructor]
MAYFRNISFIVAIVSIIALFAFNFGEEVYSNGRHAVIVEDYRDADLTKASNLQDQQEKFDESVDVWQTFNNERFATSLHSYARDLSKDEVIKLLSTLKELHFWMQIVALFNVKKTQDHFAENHPEVPQYGSLAQFFRQKVQMVRMLKSMSERQLQSFCDYMNNCDDTILTNTEASDTGIFSGITDEEEEDPSNDDPEKKCKIKDNKPTIKRSR